MALGEHDNLDELWPTRWAEQFDGSVAGAYPTRACCHVASDYRLSDTLVRVLSGTIADRLIKSQMHAALRACESPIERALLAALLVEITAGAFGCALWSPGLINDRRRCFVRLPEMTWSHSARRACEGWSEPPRLIRNRTTRFILYPQLKLGPYRADMFVVFEDCLSGAAYLRRRMVIECDGHDYHERTKEQASADKARDRYMQARGHLVFRFSGADIWRDPITCAREVLGTLTRGVV